MKEYADSASASTERPDPMREMDWWNRWNGGCKGYQTGMYYGMLYCRSYGYNVRTTPCAAWAHPSDPGINSGALGSTHAQTEVVNIGGNCCSNSTFVALTEAADAELPE